MMVLQMIITTYIGTPTAFTYDKLQTGNKGPQAYHAGRSIEAHSFKCMTFYLLYMIHAYLPLVCLRHICPNTTPHFPILLDMYSTHVTYTFTYVTRHSQGESLALDTDATQTEGGNHDSDNGRGVETDSVTAPRAHPQHGAQVPIGGVVRVGHGVIRAEEREPLNDIPLERVHAVAADACRLEHRQIHEALRERRQ